MTPERKTLLIVLSSIIGVFLVPAILIIFHDYIYAFIAITTFLACFILFGYYSYEEFYPFINQRYKEDEDAYHQFHGDPEKIRFYKAFRKYFDGDLDAEGLKQYLIKHPRKH